MACDCCSKPLNNGMIHKSDPSTGESFKSCPRCSNAEGREHVFHSYPESFGQTEARETPRNPEGDQSYCIDCRRLSKGQMSTAFSRGRKCSSLV